MSARPDLGRSTDATSLALAPTSPAAALSRDQVHLPELPAFRGPGWGLLSTIRWVLPLLIGGAFYSAATHGWLNPLVVSGGLALGLVGTAAAHTTLVRRKRKLRELAAEICSYAERTRSPADELSQRARAAMAMLSERWRPGDARLANEAEQGLHYTRELLRRGV